MKPLGEEEIALIVARAREIGPRERLACLRRACAGDERALQLALRALDLLTVRNRYDDSDGAIHSDDDAAWAFDRSGQVLGSWKLLRRLGGGGMSEVYLAERCGEYSHRVAVKLVRPGLVSRADFNRLRAERQILARLSHRNIARLLDGGTTADGIPYLVMEYVDGEPIDVYCDRHRLSIRERLALFRGVCAAVHAAHQNHIIHRDLKPSNILVTKDRTLKLLDFGIAKLTNATDTLHTLAITQADMRLFTPGHASPEQIRGEPITRRSDVYQLGVLLYQLLVGRRPFCTRNMRLAAIEQMLSEQTPPPPSSVLNVRGKTAEDGANVEKIAYARSTTPARLRRELAGDLDNIVMKALRAEPERRYASADEMALDLKRYDRGEPVSARPDTWCYRTGKFVRRHIAGISVAASLAVVFAGFTGVIAWQAQRLAEERALAEHARRQSEEALELLSLLINEGVGTTQLAGLQHKSGYRRALELLSHSKSDPLAADMDQEPL